MGRWQIVRAGLILALTIMSLGWRTNAQEGFASLSGTVTDSGGLAIVGVTVRCINANTNATITQETNEAGLYNFPSLLPGTYRLEVEKEGFEKIVRSGLVLHVADNIAQNLTLKVGSVAQTVTVSGEAPIVNTTTSSLGGLVNDDKIAELPLNGRNFVDLAFLQPGVTNNTNYNSSMALGGTQGVWFSSNGAPLRSNNVTIDGAPMMNPRGTTSSAIGVTLGVDGIKEYKVITDSFSAEYGLLMGSQVVMVSKGGTNRFHGDAFDYLRNNVLDARNYFDEGYLTTGKRNSLLQRNNFGGSFGGPIQKDKTFFYGVYEALRQNLGNPLTDTVLAAGCHGPAGAVITNAACPQLGTVASATIAPVAAPLLGLLPNPSAGLGGNRFFFVLNTPTRVDYGQMRVDHTFSGSDSMFVRYTVDDNYGISPQGVKQNTNGYPQIQTGTQGRDQFLSLAETHIFSSSVLNTGRVSYSRTGFATIPTYSQNLIGPAYSFVQGLPVGDIVVPGVSAFGPNSTPGQQVQNIITLSDDLYYTRGRHTLKFGTLLNHFENANTSEANAVGAITFGSVAGFLKGIPSSYTALTPGNDQNMNYFYYTMGFYGQDDWRVNSRLTLNLGLRYEFETTPLDTHGRNFAFQDFPVDVTTTNQAPLENKSLHNFSPRIGLAWDVTGKGKTSVRAAFGKYYDVGAVSFLLNTATQGTPGIATTNTTQVAATSTTPIVLPLVFSGVGSVSLHTLEYDHQEPYLLEENLTIEQQLPLDSALSVSYVGSRGVHLWMGEEGNPCIPTSITNGIPFWAKDCGNGRLNPNFGANLEQTTNGYSSYNALQATLNKRAGHGLQYQVSYTYAKILDDTQGQGGSGECTSSGAALGVYPADKRRFDYGPACWDARDNLRFNVLYHLPGMKSGNSILRGVTSGWWTGSLVSWQTGFPFTPLVSTFRSLSDHLSNQTGQSDHASVGTATVAPGQVGPDGTVNKTSVTFVPYNASTVITGNPNQWFNPLMFIPGSVGYLGTASRDMLRGPRLADWDLSINKDTALPFLGEGGALQFRAEFFNILNHPNFGMPNGTAYSGTLTDTSNYVETPLSTAGQILTTVTTSRQIQFALKIVF